MTNTFSGIFFTLLQTNTLQITYVSCLVIQTQELKDCFYYSFKKYSIPRLHLVKKCYIENIIKIFFCIINQEKSFIIKGKILNRTN